MCRVCQRQLHVLPWKAAMGLSASQCVKESHLSSVRNKSFVPVNILSERLVDTKLLRQPPYLCLDRVEHVPEPIGDPDGLNHDTRVLSGSIGGPRRGRFLFDRGWGAVPTHSWQFRPNTVHFPGCSSSRVTWWCWSPNRSTPVASAGRAGSHLQTVGKGTRASNARGHWKQARRTKGSST
eukprot:scaffold148_cov341-Pavlova_lutheri.AAC.21